MKMRVKLSSPEDIRKFVEIASRYKQDMELMLGLSLIHICPAKTMPR